jgi:hypothetical protein
MSSYTELVRELCHSVAGGGKTNGTTAKSPATTTTTHDHGLSEQNRARRQDILRRLQEGSGFSLGTDLMGPGELESGTTVDRSDCVFQKLGLEKVLKLEEARPTTLSGTGGDKADQAEDDWEGLGGLPTDQRSMGKKKKFTKSVDKPFEIIIPLSHDRVRVADIKQSPSFRTEYATRYCEHLGVTPTQQNINTVLQSMPLEQCRIRQVLHPGLGRGERRNHVAIEPMYHPTPPRDSQNHRTEPIDILQALKGAERTQSATASQTHNDDSEVGRFKKHQSTVDATQPERDSHATRLPTFDTYKSKFLYPYNLPDRFETHPTKAVQLQGKVSTVASPAVTGNETSTRPREPHAPSTSSRLMLHDALLSKISGSSPQDAPAPSGSVSGTGKEREQVMTGADIARLQRLLGEPFEDTEFDLESETGNAPEKSGHEKSASAKRGSQLTGVPSQPPMDRTELLQSKLDPGIQREINSTALPDFQFDDVKHLQQGFLHDFPFEKYFSDTPGKSSGGQVNAARPTAFRISGDPRFRGDQSENREGNRLARVRAFLSDRRVTLFLTDLLRFVGASYVARLMEESAPGASTSEREDLFVHIFDRLLDILHFSNDAEGKSQVALDIPFFVLMVRVVIDSQLNLTWPQLFRSEVGKEIKSRVYCFLSAILDPTGLCGHLSKVESTPKALRVLHRKRLPENSKVSPYRTTPLTQFIVGDGSSSETKLLLRSRRSNLEKSPELAELESQLTPMVRSRLLQCLTSRKLL